FTYTVSDGQGGTDTATVNIYVTPVNDAPVAVGDSLTTLEDTAITYLVLSNDYDVDGDILYISSVTNGSNGVVTVNPDGTLIYTPNANFNGTDSFTYTVTDGQGGTDTATVNVNVIPVNDAPVAQYSSSSLNENSANGTVVGIVVATDPDLGDTLTYSITGGNSGGAFGIDYNIGLITVADSSQLDYETTPSYDLTVQVEDSGGLTDAATITVNLLDVVGG
ncbi:Ig-like domain-containing protein, partial [Chloroflexota bacterium]